MNGEIKCHHCNQPLQFDDEQAGKLLECPLCNFKTRAEMKPPAPPVNPRLARCADCDGEVSPRAPLCPHCGGFRRLPFGLVLQAVCWVMLATGIMTLIGWLFGFALASLK
jgi:DNA-directed RNA polymerase subunit RPC12/RpoP